MCGPFNFVYLNVLTLVLIYLFCGSCYFIGFTPPILIPKMTLLSLPLPVALQNALLPLFRFLIGFFAILFETSDELRSKVGPPAQANYDFIVVGGGSAGSGLAARLAETGKVTVLLIEAGGDPNPIALLPAAVTVLRHPQIDWMYETVRLNGSGFGMKNGVSLWPRGKSLGGSSNNNFMFYQRGNLHDYNNWATITGDERWSFFNIERIFRRMEDYHGYWEQSPYHSQGGPLRVERNGYEAGVAEILAAASEMGMPTRDTNSIQVPSFGPIDFTMKRGLRFSTYRAYIKPNLHRSNFVIHRYSHAAKVHFDDYKKAIGVTYFRHGTKTFVRATKEIVLCAGTVNSPQLLMLSGIGPRNHLLEHGIDLLVDLPGVGQNLQDHISSTVGPFLLDRPISLLPERDVTVGALLNHVVNGKGPLSAPNAATVIGFIPTRSAPSPTWPNIMFTLLSFGVGQASTSILTNFGGILDSVLGPYFAPHVGRDAHLAVVTLGLPKSKGEIRLKDSSPFSKPIIDPRYYSDVGGHDMEAMLDGMEWILRMYENTTAMNQVGGRLIPNKLPGCENFVGKSRRYLECVARAIPFTLYHPVGTCAMGKETDRRAVVNSELKVIGVQGLRVVDASIMPQVTNANTNAPSIMIGEVGADLIKTHWNL